MKLPCDKSSIPDQRHQSASYCNHHHHHQHSSLQSSAADCGRVMAEQTSRDVVDDVAKLKNYCNADPVVNGNADTHDGGENGNGHENENVLNNGNGHEMSEKTEGCPTSNKERPQINGGDAITKICETDENSKSNREAAKSPENNGEAEPSHVDPRVKDVEKPIAVKMEEVDVRDVAVKDEPVEKDNVVVKDELVEKDNVVVKDELAEKGDVAVKDEPVEKRAVLVKVELDEQLTDDQSEKSANIVKTDDGNAIENGGQFDEKKSVAPDTDLEKLKNDGGLRMQLDSGETFEVQMISSGDSSGDSDDDSDEDEATASSNVVSLNTTTGAVLPNPSVQYYLQGDKLISSKTITLVPNGQTGINSLPLSGTVKLGSYPIRMGAATTINASQAHSRPTILAHSQVYRDAKGNVIRKPLPPSVYANPVQKATSLANLIGGPHQQIIIQDSPIKPVKPAAPSNEELAIEFNKRARTPLTINTLIDALKEFGLNLDYLKEAEGNIDGDQKAGNSDEAEDKNNGADKEEGDSVKSEKNTAKKCLVGSADETDKTDFTDGVTDSATVSEDVTKTEESSKNNKKEVCKTAQSKAGVNSKETSKKLNDKKGDEEEDTSHKEVAKKLRPVAKFLYFTGLDFGREVVYSDLVIAGDKKHKAHKLHGPEIHDLQQLKKLYLQLRSKNKSLRAKHHKACQSCSFTTESNSVLYFHQQQGHLDDRTVRWSCALCDYGTRVVSEFTFHMEAEHDMKAFPLSRPQFFNCSLCYYTSSTRAHWSKHMQKCEKQFIADKHQFPTYDDINFIFRALPGPLIKVPVPATVATTKLLDNRINPSPRYPHVNATRFVTLPSGTFPVLPGSIVQHSAAPGVTAANPFRLATNTTAAGLRQPPPLKIGQMIQARSQGHSIINGQIQMPALKSVVQSSPVSINPQLIATTSTYIPPSGVKRPAPPMVAPVIRPKTPKYSYEVCEICGGFVLDRSALRLHFSMAHNITIREEALDVNRSPPLSCDFCSSRFWTYQGLSLHKARSNHVRADQALCHICNTLTSDMPTHIKNAHNIVPNQLNTIRICPVCGKAVLNEKTETHIERVHNIKLEKPQTAAERELKTIKPIFKCQQCSSKFTEKSMLQLHMRKEHPGDNAISDVKKCELCGSSVSQSLYDAHILTAHCKRKLMVKLKRCDTDGDQSESDGAGDAEQMDHDDGDDTVQDDASANPVTSDTDMADAPEGDDIADNDGDES